MQRPEIKQDNATKPSLLSSENEINQENDHILAKFETSLGTRVDSARSNWLNRKWWVWVGGLIMIAASTAGTSYVKSLSQYEKKDVATTKSHLAAPQAPLSNSSPASAVLDLQSNTTAETQVATIVTESVEPRREVNSGKYGAGTGADLSKSSLGSYGSQFSGGEPSKQPVGNPRHDNDKLHAKAEGRHGGSTVRVPHNPDQKAREPSKSERNAFKQANALASDRTDRDVTMLAALIANTNESQTSKVNTEQRATKKLHQPAKSRSSQSSNMSLSENAQGRDIVERKPNDSSEALLQRCKQLGFIEGQFCRWRICSGRWESDAVCKASAGQS